MPIPQLVDTHCHLTSKDLYPQHDRIIAQALDAGASRMIPVTCRADEAGIGLELRSRHQGVFVAAGIHPHEAGRMGPDEIERLSEIWSQAGVVAAGEMGLDYHYDFSPRE